MGKIRIVIMDITVDVKCTYNGDVYRFRTQMRLKYMAGQRYQLNEIKIRAENDYI